MYQPSDHRLIPFPSLLHFMGDNVVRDTCQSSSLDSRVFPLDGDTEADPEVLELRAEVERLRAELAELREERDHREMEEQTSAAYRDPD